MWKLEHVKLHRSARYGTDLDDTGGKGWAMRGEDGDSIVSIGRSDTDNVWSIARTVRCATSWAGISECKDRNNVDRIPRVDNLIVPRVLLTTSPRVGAQVWSFGTITASAKTSDNKFESSTYSFPMISIDRKLYPSQFVGQKVHSPQEINAYSEQALVEQLENEIQTILK